MIDPTSLLAERLKDRYRFERELGRGGMATVYLARDLKHDRPVALKLLDPDVASAIGTDRFQREIRFAARLQHSHICPVYDSGDAAGRLWYAMPYIEGESLYDRLRREERLPVDEALRIAREAALALAYAHQQGVVHRDIKPANILLALDGSTLVADFGIARPLDGLRSGREQTLTEAGFAPGTPAYMSPEQAAGARDVDGRSDIYSLGLVLYEMLIGERPFGAGSLAAFAQLMTDPVPRVVTRRPEVPPALDQILQQALAFDPAARFPTMASFGVALESARLGRSGPQPGRFTWAFVVDKLLSGFRKSPQSQPVPPASAAVLPFLDQSPTKDQTYFSDGLTEELTTALSRIPGLKVAARSSAFQFRGAEVAVRDAGRKLGVGSLITGSVRRSGDRLRVSAQLVDVGDGFERWSESYDRGMADVFQVQEEIARSIATALRVRLGGPVEQALARRPTADLEAYDLYLQGRFAWHQRTSATLSEAARCFEQATARDAGFARAWAGLADACILLPFYSGAPPGTMWPRAKAAALKAIELDENLAEAHTALGYGTMLYDWDWEMAEREFRRAIAADPDYPIAHHWYADFLAGRGRFEEALAEMRRAQELDPLSRITGVEIGWIYHLMGRQREAEAEVSRVLRLDPTFSHGHFILGMILRADGRAAEAVAALHHSLGLGGFNAHTTAALIAALVAAGLPGDAEAELELLRHRAASEYVPPFAFAIAYANLGDADSAFRWVDRGVAERDVLLPENFFEPLFYPLKADPRYARIAAMLTGSAIGS